MHIVVAGASGATGAHLVSRARASGHRVTAIVRDPANYDAPVGTEVLTADLVSGDPPELPADADAVVSSLGMRSDAPVCGPATQNLLEAMRHVGIRRIVVTSAVPAHASGPGEPWWFRMVRRFVRRSMPRIYDDLEDMECRLRRCDAAIRWTIVRPGYLTDDGPTEFTLLPERNATTSIPRADLAHALLTLAADEHAVGDAYGIRRGRSKKTGSAA